MSAKQEDALERRHARSARARPEGTFEALPRAHTRGRALPEYLFCPGLALKLAERTSLWNKVRSSLYSDEFQKTPGVQREKLLLNNFIYLQFLVF